MADERGGEVIKGTLEMIVLEVLQHEPMHAGASRSSSSSATALLSVNQGRCIRHSIGWSPVAWSLRSGSD